MHKDHIIIKILLLISSIQPGDMNQGNSTLEALSANASIEIFDIDANKPPEAARLEYLDKIKNIPQKTKYITLAMGEKGMILFKYLSEAGAIDNSRSYNCLSVHQYFDVFAELKLDHIIVPEATIDKIEKQKVIDDFPNKTFTFASLGSHPSLKELKKSYNNWSNPDKPDLNGSYIIIMMPGDAPDASNKIHYFTKTSAKELFHYIHKLWEDRGRQDKIIIQNGPRTGKYDPQTEKVIGTHEYLKDQDPSRAIDYISTYFTELFSGMDYSFFNFAFEIDGDKKKVISFFDSLLYLAQLNDNIFILPGDSVSLIGQIPLYLPSNRIILFKTSSMNENHEKIFNLAFKRNYISYFSSNGKIVMPAKIGYRTEDDSTKVAKDIMIGYIKKFK